MERSIVAFKTDCLFSQAERVRYVSDSSTGWAAIVKTVTGVDQSKIQDCKDDMDTLLVFVSPVVLWIPLEMCL